MRGLGLVMAASVALATLVGCQSNPKYDLTVKLAGTDGGATVNQELSSGTASLRYFSCSVSVRLGQCIQARPIQIVVVPAGVDQSGSPTCPNGSAKQILTRNLGTPIKLSKDANPDAGVDLVWIQAFHGDDDDDSNVVEPAEMAAYAELTNGTLTVDRLDDRFVGEVHAANAAGNSELSGSIGAVDSENTLAVAVGPRCTWPIAAKPE